MRKRKQLEKLEANPKGVSMEVLESVMSAFGYEHRKGKGAHRVYTKPGAYPLTVPHRRHHVGQPYVEQVIVRLREELREEGDEQDR